MDYFVYFPPNPDFTFLLVNPLLKVLARVLFSLFKSHTFSTKISPRMCKSRQPQVLK